ncbi:MAG TPA: NAD-dependent epimerase/dehydratase family protein [Puia sp.]
MKILIIGGTGNISRWFTHSLVEAGEEVTLCNRGLNGLSFPGEVRQVMVDRTDRPAFRREMEKAGTFDCVIDMVGFEPEDGREAVEIFQGRTGQFIFCSTVDVYSKEQLVYPVPAEQIPCASPGFPYAYKKMQLEQVLMEAFQKQGFPVTIIRPAATYSEGVSPLLTPFGRQSYHLDRLRKGLPVVLHGDGHSIWVEAHAADVARAFTGAIGNGVTIGKSYNVTGEELLTWRSMYTIVAEELGAPSPRFVCIPTELLGRLAPEESEWCGMNFQYNNIFDNSAARRDLDYRYTIAYREGARRCLRHLLDRNAIEDEAGYPFYDRLLEEWENLTSIK